MVITEDNLLELFKQMEGGENVDFLKFGLMKLREIREKILRSRERVKWWWME
jgi:hypothetical protein